VPTVVGSLILLIDWVNLRLLRWEIEGLSYLKRPSNADLTCHEQKPTTVWARRFQQPGANQANEPRARGQSVSIVGRQLALPAKRQPFTNNFVNRAYLYQNESLPFTKTCASLV